MTSYIKQRLISWGLARDFFFEWKINCEDGPDVESNGFHR